MLVLPVLKDPVSVENFKGPPKIDCLSGSDVGSVKFTFEHDIKNVINKIYINLNINKTRYMNKLFLYLY